jgi:hypothetical protein
MLSYTIIQHTLSYNIIYYHIMSCTIIHYHIASYNIIYYHILSHTIMTSYTVLNYHIASYNIKYYISYSIIFWFVMMTMQWQDQNTMTQNFIFTNVLDIKTLLASSRQLYYTSRRNIYDNGWKCRPDFVGETLFCWALQETGFSAI